MKNLLTLFALVLFGFTAAQAATIAITPSSLEVITTGATSRTFYDLDDVFIRYKAGNVTVYEAAKSTILFDGDTSEVTVSGATHWYQKAAKLIIWYQDASTTSGYRFFFPRRGVNLLYKTSTAAVKLVDNVTKNLLFETHVDSIKISGISGASAKLTYFRGQYYLEGNRNNRGQPNTPTIAAGSAAGSSPTIAIAGTANSFTVTMTVGTTALNSGTIWTATLPFSYPTGTVLSVRNVNANAKTHDARVLIAGGVATVVATATTTALTDGGQYIWDIGVAGY